MIEIQLSSVRIYEQVILIFASDEFTLHFKTQVCDIMKVVFFTFENLFYEQNQT